jgi:hypothetical protein
MHVEYCPLGRFKKFVKLRLLKLKFLLPAVNDSGAVKYEISNTNNNKYSTFKIAFRLVYILGPRYVCQ